MMTTTTERMNQTPQELRTDGFQTIQALTAEMNRSIVMNMDSTLAAVGGVALGGALLEGGSGEGKTLLALSMAKAAGGTFVREQGTADKLPSDFLGNLVYHQGKQDFVFRPGPVFDANVLLADEFNRNSEKAQTGFLELFGERQITIAGVTYQVKDPFTVFATQNLQNEYGTNPLPRATLDRFPISIDTAQTEDEQADVLDFFLDNKYETQQVVEATAISGLRKAIKTVEIAKEYRQAIMTITKEVANHPKLDSADSIVKGRAKLRVADLARFHALSRGKEVANVNLADIYFASQFVFPHRIVPTFDAVNENIKPIDIVQESLKKAI